MPRQLWIEYPGAIYLVMNRGDRREPIFKDDFDRRWFVSTLAQAQRRTGDDRVEKWQLKPEEQNEFNPECSQDCPLL